MKIGLMLRKRIGQMVTSPAAYKAKLLDELMRVPGLLVIVTNAQFELTMANDFFYSYFNCVPDLLAGKMLYSFIGDDMYNDMNEAHISRVITNGHIWDYDARTTRPDGEVILIRWNQGVFYDSGHQLNILSVGVIHSQPAEENPLLTIPALNPLQFEAGYSQDPSENGYETEMPAGFSISEAEINQALDNDNLRTRVQ